MSWSSALHFVLCADGDADVAGGDVSAVAEDDFVFGHGGDEIGTDFAKIDEDEISRAGIGLEAELVEFGFEPGAEAEDVFHVALHGF